MDEQWLPNEVWDRPPSRDACVFDVVHDPDLGALAQATSPSGAVAYGTDSPTAG